MLMNPVHAELRPEWLLESLSQDAAPERVIPEEPPWTWSLDAYTINPPHAEAYVTPMLRADRDALHLEARYNYEDRDTASFWVGRNYDWSDEVQTHLVPMAGLVTGQTDGAALGCELDSTWKRLNLYLETEYLFDFGNSDDDFLFTWTELTFAASERFYFGIVGQRTRVYDTDLSVDWGPLVGCQFGQVSASFYWFNPERGDSYGAFTVGYSR